MVRVPWDPLGASETATPPAGSALLNWTFALGTSHSVTHRPLADALGGLFKTQVPRPHPGFLGRDPGI